MDLKIALYINEDIPPESQRIICASKILTENDKLIAELAGNVDKLHLVNLKVTPTTQPPAELAQFGAKLKVDSVVATTSSNAIAP